MKKMMLLAVAALFGAGIVCAALTATDLTPKAIRTAIAAKPVNQRQDYARQIIEAVAATPQDETAKTQALTSTARALIAGARTGGALGIIAEVYNSVPIANLQGVSDLLAINNFGQKLNGMSDEQFNAFATRLVSAASKYIEASGTDSPTLRISILAAAFTKASEDPERTREALIAALPATMQAAAATYIPASENNNAEVLAAAAGVDAVEPTPADPDAASVVQPQAAAPETAAAPQADAAGAEPDAETPAVAEATPAAPAQELPLEEDEAPKAETDYLTPDPAGIRTVDTDPAAEPEAAKVPLIARLVSDIQGSTLDAMNMAMYEWDTVDPEERIDDPALGTLPGLGSAAAVPGEAAPSVPEELPRWDVEEMEAPSPGYPNQRTSVRNY